MLNIAQYLNTDIASTDFFFLLDFSKNPLKSIFSKDTSAGKIYQANALYYLLAGFSFDLEETRVSICKIFQIYILDRSFLKTFHLRCSLKRINTQ